MPSAESRRDDRSLSATASAAEYLGLRPKTLANWRSTDTGPPYRRHGGRIVYAIEELDKWSAQRAV